jgi:hypothetical protein
VNNILRYPIWTNGCGVRSIAKCRRILRALLFVALRLLSLDIAGSWITLNHRFKCIECLRPIKMLAAGNAYPTENQTRSLPDCIEWQFCLCMDSKLLDSAYKLALATSSPQNEDCLNFTFSYSNGAGSSHKELMPPHSTGFF